MKVKIFLAGLSLALVSCESMDLVPKSQGNTASWYTNETELALAANEFYILGYWQEPLNSSEQWCDNTTYRLQNRNPGSQGKYLARIDQMRHDHAVIDHSFRNLRITSLCLCCSPHQRAHVGLILVRHGRSRLIDHRRGTDAGSFPHVYLPASDGNECSCRSRIVFHSPFLALA